MTEARKPRMKKVILIGDSQTGKTCLMQRCVDNEFRPIYRATIGADFMTKRMSLNDKDYALQIWDTAGQERFQSLGVAFYRGADLAIVLFDVTSKLSFEHVPNWIEEFRFQTSDDVPIIVVGNKTEEPDSVVTPEDVEELCGRVGENTYFTFVDVKNAVNTAQFLEGVLRTLKGEKVFGEKKPVKSARNVGSNSEDTEEANVAASEQEEAAPTNLEEEANVTENEYERI